MEKRKIKSATMYSVKTQEAYNQLMLELESKGYKWGPDTSASQKNYWNTNKEKTVIEIYNEGIKDIKYRNSEILDIDQEVIDYNYDKTKLTIEKPIKVLFKSDILKDKYIEYTVSYQEDNYVKVSTKDTMYWVPLTFAQFEVKLHNWIVISEDNFLINPMND